LEVLGHCPVFRCPEKQPRASFITDPLKFDGHGTELQHPEATPQEGVAKGMVKNSIRTMAN
jgi:hypothetical protein